MQFLLLHKLTCYDLRLSTAIRCTVRLQDSTVLEVAVVDLHGGQPLPSPARGRAPGLRGTTPPPPAPSATRHRQCRLHPVDPSLFSSRPGLLLLQASWHPHSEAHLLLLTSDNRLRLYHVTHTLALAEQTLHLMPQSGPAPQRYGLAGAASAVGTPSSPAYGLAAAGVGAPLATDIVAFAFGPAVGWGLFSLLAMAADGHVYAVGPVAPFGEPTKALRSMPQYVARRTLLPVSSRHARRTAAR